MPAKVHAAPVPSGLKIPSSRLRVLQSPPFSLLYLSRRRALSFSPSLSSWRCLERPAAAKAAAFESNTQQKSVSGVVCTPRERRSLFKVESTNQNGRGVVCLSVSLSGAISSLPSRGI